MSGDIDTVFEFCNRVTGDDNLGDAQYSSISCDTLTIIDPNDCGGCGPGGEGGETIILIDDLLIRPSIFMIVPSPFGDTENNKDYTGLWGVNVANPTIKDMVISKVTIVVYPPGGNSQDTVFQAEGVSDNKCKVEDITPNKGTQPQGYWSCPRDNILMWQSFTDTVTVPANTTKSFLARAEPYQIKTAGDNLDALIVQANVYTDFGSFGKTGYQSSMYELDAPIVNVYHDNSTNINDRDNFVSHFNDITENSTETFDIVLADLDEESDTVINTGAKLIINIPREWNFTQLNNYAGFVDPPTVTVHSDKSTQIVGVTNAPIGDGVNDARKISFDAKAPDVKIQRLYIMYVLADGTVTNTSGELKTIGPLNEMVLNVDP
ncbi:MAG: hypothetical protein OEQ12_01755, partial [Nitrosopumilus sp.]|nr:hypothetical protein [Nitrosopumilus sp.]